MEDHQLAGGSSDIEVALIPSVTSKWVKVSDKNYAFSFQTVFFPPWLTQDFTQETFRYFQHHAELKHHWLQICVGYMSLSPLKLHQGQTATEVQLVPQLSPGCF